MENSEDLIINEETINDLENIPSFAKYYANADRKILKQIDKNNEKLASLQNEINHRLQPGRSRKIINKEAEDATQANEKLINGIISAYIKDANTSVNDILVEVQSQLQTLTIKEYKKGLDKEAKKLQREIDKDDTSLLDIIRPLQKTINEIEKECKKPTKDLFVKWLMLHLKTYEYLAIQITGSDECINDLIEAHCQLQYPSWYMNIDATSQAINNASRIIALGKEHIDELPTRIELLNHNNDIEVLGEGWLKFRDRVKSKEYDSQVQVTTISDISCKDVNILKLLRITLEEANKQAINSYGKYIYETYDADNGTNEPNKAPLVHIPYSLLVERGLYENIDSARHCVEEIFDKIGGIEFKCSYAYRRKNKWLPMFYTRWTDSNEAVIRLNNDIPTFCYNKFISYSPKWMYSLSNIPFRMMNYICNYIRTNNDLLVKQGFVMLSIRYIANYLGLPSIYEEDGKHIKENARHQVKEAIEKAIEEIENTQAKEKQLYFEYVDADRLTYDAKNVKDFYENTYLKISVGKEYMPIYTSQQKIIDVKNIKSNKKTRHFYKKNS